ncbi:MAG: HD domain-containing phosphohydrolase [Pseudomonadota bacterium]
MDIKNSEHTILLVDDEENILSALNRMLVSEEYNVLTASSGQEGLRLLDTAKVSLIISDQRMPAMTGSEFLAKAKDTSPDSIRIMLTGYSDINATIEAINSGEVYKYITKPWQDEELMLTVKEAIERYSLIAENKRLTEVTLSLNKELKQWNEKLEQRVEEQTQDIKKRNKALLLLNEKLKKTFITSLEALSGLIELRNEYVGNHSKNVSELSVKTAVKMGLPEKEVEVIRAAALLHDIGKIGISDAILHKDNKRYLLDIADKQQEKDKPKVKAAEKDGADDKKMPPDSFKDELHLSDEEIRQIEQHPVRGQAAVAAIEGLSDAGLMIRHHHEWFNGDGYPDRLRHDAIPLGSRIIAIADAVDRYANPGEHAGKYNFTIALRYIKADGGKKYDPSVFAAMEAIVRGLAKTVSRNIGSDDDEYFVDDLRPGMVLSKDVRSGTGVLVVPQETTLTESNIDFLKRIYAFDPHPRGIFVWKKQ